MFEFTGTNLWHHEHYDPICMNVQFSQFSNILCYQRNLVHKHLSSLCSPLLRKTVHLKLKVAAGLQQKSSSIDNNQVANKDNSQLKLHDCSENFSNPFFLSPFKSTVILTWLLAIPTSCCWKMLTATPSPPCSLGATVLRFPGGGGGGVTLDANGIGRGVAILLRGGGGGSGILILLMMSLFSSVWAALLFICVVSSTWAALLFIYHA